MIIDLSKGEGDNQIPKGGIFTKALIMNLIFILLYQTFTPGSPFT